MPSPPSVHTFNDQIIFNDYGRIEIGFQSTGAPIPNTDIQYSGACSVVTSQKWSQSTWQYIGISLYLHLKSILQIYSCYVTWLNQWAVWCWKMFFHWISKHWFLQSKDTNAPWKYWKGVLKINVLNLSTKPLYFGLEWLSWSMLAY